MEFAVALLGVAAFMLVTGVVGHDTGGALTLTVKGKVGPLPRVLLVALSVPALALALLVHYLPPGSAVGPPTTPTPAAGSRADPPSTTPGGAASADPVAGGVPVTLHAGLRPWLGETLEAMTLVVDGEQVASWNLGGTTLEAAQPLVLTPGRHEYRLAGSYTWTDPGGRAATVPATGSGHVDVVAGGRLEVVYLPDGTFGLTAG